MRRMWSATALLLASVTAACAKDPNVAKREYTDSGDRYTAAGKYAEAIVEYRNAVQQDPRFADARKKLGDAYIKVGDLPNALREYIRAAELLPDETTLQLRTGNLLLLSRRFDDARKKADAILSRGPNADAQILRANALAGLNQLDDALAQMEEAIRTDPDRASIYGNLGTLQLVRGHPADAEAAYRKAIEIDPSSALAHTALANFYIATDRRADAELEFLTAVRLRPQDGLANRALAYFYVGAGRLAEAEPYLKVVAHAAPGSAGQLALADYYVATKRIDESKAALDDVIRHGDDPAVTAAKLRLAALAQGTGDSTTAARLVGEVLKAHPTDPLALLANAELLLRAGKLDEALASVTKAADLNSRSAEVQFQLGRIHAARRNLTGAVGAFHRALQLNPRLVAANVQLAKLQLQAGRTNEAEEFASSAARQAPGDAEISLLLAQVNIAKGQLTKAESWLRQVEREHPDAPAVQTEVGRLQLGKNNPAAARAAFMRALAAQPTYVEALAAVTRLDLQQRQGPAATMRLDAALKVSPRDPGILMLAGMTRMAQRDPVTAERLLRDAIDADPNYLEAYEQLARLYVSSGRLADATAQFEQVVARQPKSVGAQTVIGLLLQMQNRPADARKQFEHILEIDSHAAVAANNLAWIYAEDGGNLDQALQLAQTAKARLPDQHEVNDTLGWVYHKKGLSALAIPPLLQAIDKSPRNASYHYHLGLAYAATDEPTKARTSLERALALDAHFSAAADARRVLAGLKSE